MFGLSLGNYEASIAVYKRGRENVLANEGGERNTPMMVTYSSKNNILVGSPSKQAHYRNVESTVVSVMELLQASQDEAELLGRELDCKVQYYDNEPYYCIEGVGTYSVKNTLCHLLKQLAYTAHLCDSISPIPIVIATPAYFSEQKISVLRDCAQDCGFNVIGNYDSSLLSLLPYGFGSENDLFSGNILVYDLGLKSLTLSLIRSDSGLLKCVLSKVFHGVGGGQLDEILLSLLKSEGQRLYRKDVTINNQRALYKLLSAAEQAKHTLSSQNATKIYIESLYDGMDFQHTLSRGKFEGICLPIFKSFLQPINLFLLEANLNVSHIQKVILVGGTCKIPKLQQMLYDVFSSSEILSSVSTDHVVALGASLQAAYISNILLNDSVPQKIPCIANDILLKYLNSDCEPSTLLLAAKCTPLPYRMSATVTIKLSDPTNIVILSIEEESGENVLKVKVPLSSIHLSKDCFSLIIDCFFKSADSEKDPCTAKIIIKDKESEWKAEVHLTK